MKKQSGGAENLFTFVVAVCEQWFWGFIGFSVALGSAYGAERGVQLAVIWSTIIASAGLVCGLTLSIWIYGWKETRFNLIGFRPREDR